MIRLVAQVFHHRQLLGLHLAGDLLEDTGGRGLVWQGGDHDVTVFRLPHRPHPDRAVACLVQFQQFFARGDDFRFGGKIRALDVFAQLRHRGFRLVEQPQAGGHHFLEVVRRNVGCHAHRDAGAAIEQHVGQPRGQHRRFL
jgi:hypothetical protein